MTHPYKAQPPAAFWSRAMAGVAPEEVNPASAAPFRITPQDAVVTAGSCFAQHIGSMLKIMRFNFLVTESAHPVVDDALAQAFNYGVFSARYGNVYTARQLLQLMQRAYGAFRPREDVWQGENGSWIDPFRPQIQPGGFLSVQELRLDRERHFAAVRQAFETLDVFIFTLGLTEAWAARADGAVFTICPGTAGGVFDAAKHEFMNFSVMDVVEDMTAFVSALRLRNPKARVILTVSPVPLVATARADTHVLAATTYSKSVLRVAAETLTKLLPGVAYFPSYEIIMSRAHDAGTYFGPDKRDVQGPGVSHVMRVFVETYAGQPAAPAAPTAAPATGSAYTQTMAALVKAQCDEEALDQP